MRVVTHGTAIYEEQLRNIRQIYPPERETLGVVAITRFAETTSSRQKSAIEERSLLSRFMEVLHDVFSARTCSSLTNTSNETAA